MPKLAWLLVQPRTALDATDSRLLEGIEQDAEVTRVAALAGRFAALIRQCGVTVEKVLPDPVAEFGA